MGSQTGGNVGGSSSNPGRVGGSDQTGGTIGGSSSTPGRVGGSSQTGGNVGGSSSNPGRVGGSSSNPGRVGGSSQFFRTRANFATETQPNTKPNKPMKVPTTVLSTPGTVQPNCQCFCQPPTSTNSDSKPNFKPDEEDTKPNFNSGSDKPNFGQFARFDSPLFVKKSEAK